MTGLIFCAYQHYTYSGYITAIYQQGSKRKGDTWSLFTCFSTSSAIPRAIQMYVSVVSCIYLISCPGKRQRSFMKLHCNVREQCIGFKYYFSERLLSYSPFQTLYQILIHEPSTCLMLICVLCILVQSITSQSMKGFWNVHHRETTNVLHTSKGVSFHSTDISHWYDYVW